MELAGIHHNPTPGLSGSEFLYGHVGVTINWLGVHPLWGCIGLPLLALMDVHRKDRSAIEQNFHDVKEVHGAGEQQVRNVWCNVACWNVCLWLHTMVELWCWRRSGTTLKQREDRPWDDPSRRPSHADRVKTVRKHTLREEFSTLPRPYRASRKIQALFEVLARLLNRNWPSASANSALEQPISVTEMDTRNEGDCRSRSIVSADIFTEMSESAVTLLTWPKLSEPPSSKSTILLPKRYHQQKAPLKEASELRCKPFTEKA